VIYINCYKSSSSEEVYLCFWSAGSAEGTVVTVGFDAGLLVLPLPDVAHTATHKPLIMHTGHQALLQ